MMTQSLEIDGDQETLVFKASRYWESNVWGATVAGIGGGLVLSVVGGILFWMADALRVKMLGVILILTVAATLLAMFPGNMIAAVPIAVDLEAGRGLLLHAPLKKLYILFGEVKEIRDSTLSQVFQQGIVVKLNKRHGLIKSFVIHGAFGEQGRNLARAIQQEILRIG
jgi:hypothetical protein